MATYAAGTIVFFYHQARLCLGILAAPEGNRWQVLDMDGNAQTLAPERFVLGSDQTYPPPEPRSLKAFGQDLDEAFAKLDQQGIWTRLSQLSPLFSFEQAAEAAGCRADVCRFALYRHLRQREDRYLLKKGLWRLRSEEEISLHLARKDEEAARARYLEDVAGWLERIGAADEETSTGPSAAKLGGEEEFRRQLASELRGLLLDNEPKDLARVLRSGGSSLETAIRSLRLALGDISAQTDPIAAASGIPVAFAAGLAAQAVAPASSEILDCKAFSIDAEDSADRDDAISWEETETGWRLGVHISDVASRIPLRSGLWQVARDRVASLYLPPQTIPLLPAELSEDAFSLHQNQLRPVLSLFAELDREARIRGFAWKRGWLRVTKNLSYEAVDRQLREEERSPLLDLCRKLHDARVGEGEERKPRYSWNLQVKEDEVVMRRVDDLSPARFIIEELMILYNRLLAERACQSSLPLIYRNVTQFSEDEDEENFGIQAYLSTEARFHSGVGAQAYLHATSPIRRFTDIVNQAQFSALLAGVEPTFSRDQLGELILHIEKRLRLLRMVAHRSERHWLLRWLEQKHLGEPLDAVLLRRVKQGYLLELSRWEKRLVLRCEEGLPLRTPVKLVVARVDLEELLVFGDVVL
ncbi:MAG: RNB domain-containing ribonuclease [Candidatus Cloacimonetes bacterium]|nr:RNB domain-containing ribonuclease [Candidatus Cloacimonadota bacterium]